MFHKHRAQCNSSHIGHNNNNNNKNNNNKNKNNNNKNNTQYNSHAGQARWVEKTTCQNRVFGEEASSAIVGRFFCWHVL